MGTEKIKPELNGVAETMLLTFYARAQYSKSKKHAFYDAKAVELVERLDYDFSSASKDVAMGGGTIARSDRIGQNSALTYDFAAALLGHVGR